MRGNGLNCELARGRGCGAHAHVHNRTSSPLQGGCAPALFRGVEGAAAPPGVPGWGEEWGIELEHPSPGGGHPRGSGRPEAAQTQTARLLLRVVPAPGVTAAGPGPPGQTWAPAGTWAPPRTGKVWATAEKVVAAWEKVVAAQTFLTLSSSLSAPEAG